MNIDNYEPIDDVFKKEVGYDINTVIKKLNATGLTSKDLEEITKKFKDDISQEIEKRNIPYDYRFLVLNLILFTLFKRAAYFQKRFNSNENILNMKDLKDNIEFRKDI